VNDSDIPDDSEDVSLDPSLHLDSKRVTAASDSEADFASLIRLCLLFAHKKLCGSISPPLTGPPLFSAEWDNFGKEFS